MGAMYIQYASSAQVSRPCSKPFTGGGRLFFLKQSILCYIDIGIRGLCSKLIMLSIVWDLEHPVVTTFTHRFFDFLRIDPLAGIRAKRFYFSLNANISGPEKFLNQNIEKKIRK